jgi:hypothetical protein
VAEFDVRSFCTGCGALRRTMPFGSYNRFWDDGPCRRCGLHSVDGREMVVAAHRRIGRWPWQRGWVDPEGNRVPASGRIGEGQ